MPGYESYFESNKELWNQRTTVHKDSAFYDVPSFLKGKSSLNNIELAELGDVKGKSILHLQCHFGLDSLSLARMGASVTALDLSDAAIEEARRLNEQAGLDARFICCNVYDMQSFLNGQFDMVFTSYGVIGWLPDLNEWARLINLHLKPGGRFYMVEFHPVVWMMDEDFKQIKYYYHNEALIETEAKGSYTDGSESLSHKEYSWNHSLSEVLNALLQQGLKLQFLNEYPYSPYPCFNHVVQGSDGNWRIRGIENKIPMVYSLMFTKQ